jgi:3-oxo-5alpha-steroid 4-dehydrogenase
MKPTDPNWHSFVEAPLVLQNADDHAWDDRADVVVVGLGGAGAAAAIEAANRGAKVLVLERFVGGGATGLSGGIIYAGGGTRQQRAAGFDDDPDNMFRYLKQETGDCVSDGHLREFCEASVANLEWLESLGLEFPGNMSPVKTSYPSNPYFLYYSGNEALPVNQKVARPAPRGHRHAARGQAGGSFFARLRDAALRTGARVSCHTKVTRLVVDAEGRVVGVEARRIDPESREARAQARILKALAPLHATAIGFLASLKPYLEKLEARAARPYTVRADQGVGLATGGFIVNRRMRAHYLPKYGGTMPNGAPGCDGSGIRLGESVGGATRLMGRASAWRFINPPLAFAQSVIVNARGERYCNESAYGAQIGFRMCEENDGVGWIVLDAAGFARARSQAMPWKVLLFQSVLSLMTMYFNRRKSDTIEGLARACGFDPQAFRATIDEYNRACQGDTADSFGKAPEFHAPIAKGPFYALNISKDSKTFPLAVISFGGLAVDEHSSQVRREDGSPVPGLYAVGRAAAGLPSNHYMSGFAIADCIFTGRKAARAIVPQPMNSSPPPLAGEVGRQAG